MAVIEIHADLRATVAELRRIADALERLAPAKGATAARAPIKITHVSDEELWKKQQEAKRLRGA